jgi:hypothetical protein
MFHLNNPYIVPFTRTTEAAVRDERKVDRNRWWFIPYLSPSHFNTALFY